MVWINCSVCCWFCYFKYLPHLFFMLYHQNLECLSVLIHSLLFKIHLSHLLKWHFTNHVSSWKPNASNLRSFDYKQNPFFFNILKIKLPINFLEFTKFSKFLILSSSTKMSPTSSQVVSGNATLTIITLFKILASNYLYSYQVHQSIHVHGIYLKAAMS